ncbi:hypothetical protein [Sulfitobacter pacificus]|uniref:hypothetical protein n=1 Tax=Sulfitobacter pacificus TaxID=1499314 RepID=UPI0031094AE6
MINPNDLRPTTLAGLKRKSKTLAKVNSIPLNAAQEMAAQQCGYSNFNHARKVLALATPPKFSIEFIHRWRDRKIGAFGTETLHFELRRDLMDFPTRWYNQFAYIDAKRERPNKMVGEYLADTQSSARMFACREARSIQFADATGLKRAAATRANKIRKRIPYDGLDHVLSWEHPDTKQVMIIDQPYTALPKATEDAWIVERRNACAEAGLLFIQPSWDGIYWPDGGCGFYLIVDQKDQSFAERVVADLDQYEPAIIEDDANIVSEVRKLPIRA